MKFVFALLVFLVMIVVLAWGILLAVRGSYWLLAAGVLGYVLMLAKIGCLPADDAH